jgi:glycogen synthase
MNIVLITSEFVSEERNFDGGLANYLNKVSLSLAERGHFPIIIVASDKDETINFKGVEVWRVKTLNKYFYLINTLTFRKLEQTLSSLWQSYYLNNKLKELGGSNKIDIVQYSSYQATALFSSRKFKAVIRISGYQPWIRMAYGNNHPSVDVKVSEWLEMLACKKVKNIFGPSKKIADQFSKILNQKIEVIESPFVPEAAEKKIETLNRINKITKSQPYLLFYGSLGLLKGAVDIVDCIEELLKKYPKIFFVFVGKDMGYKKMKMAEYIHFKAGKFGKRTIIFDKLPHNQLFPIIQKSLGGILPSRIENLPNACIESMALGKIVVGTRGSSMDQLIVDNKNGLLCEPGNPASLKVKIEQLLEMKLSRRRELENNAKKTTDRLKPEVVVNQLINYFMRLINGKQ